MQDLETGTAQLGFELAAAIAPLVPSEVVRRAPQPGMLRHRKDDASAGDERVADAREHGLIRGDMFDDVVGADEVEGRAGRNAAGVHLHEDGAVAEPAAGVQQAAGVQLRAGHTLPPARARDRVEHVARAAAHLEVAPRAREVSLDEADD